MTNDSGPAFPNELLLRERRQLKRRIASAIVRVMADSDKDFVEIARRCHRKAATLRNVVYALIEGNDAPMDVISDIFSACGYEPGFACGPLSPYADAMLAERAKGER